MKIPFYRTLLLACFVLNSFKTTAQVADYYALPYNRQSHSIGATVVSDIERKNYQRLNFPINTQDTKDVQGKRLLFPIDAKNSIEAGDTLCITIDPADSLAKAGLIVEIKFCNENCLINRRANGIATSGRVVFREPLQYQKNNTIKFVVSKRTRIIDEYGAAKFIETTTLKDVYVVVENRNPVPVSFLTSIYVKKKAPLDEGYTATTPLKPELKAATYHALLVGVTHYKDPALKLISPNTDVNRLAEVLAKHYEFSSITKLLDPTKKELKDTLMALTYRLFKDDNLLIFFAGHGGQLPNGTGYWALQDSKNGDVDSYFSNAALTGILRFCDVQQLLIVVDACFGSNLMVRRGYIKKDLEVNTYEGTYSQPSQYVLSSSRQAEVPDSNSVFLNYFLKRLQDNTEAYLTAEELFESLKYPVHSYTPLHQRPQYGSLYFNDTEPTGEGQFLFKKKTPKSSEVLVLMSNPATRILKRDTDTLDVDYVRVLDLQKSKPSLMRGVRNGLPQTGAKLKYNLTQPTEISITSRGQTLATETLLGNKTLVTTFSTPGVNLEVRGRRFYLERGKSYRLQFVPTTQTYALQE